MLCCSCNQNLNLEESNNIPKLPTKYKVWAKCVNMYLEKVNINENVTNLTVAILYFYGLDPKLLKEELSKSMKTAEKLYLFGAFQDKRRKKKLAMNTWFSTGGLLVTAAVQFQGCEADVVIVVGTDLRSDQESLGRSYEGRGTPLLYQWGHFGEQG